ncbi:MAG: hypothetical protein P4L90_14230 [Rhodopila sp.]|nr:hypothetical protein [Rhodopila sp.]
MLREELVFVGTRDMAGHVRGKGFPARAIEARRVRGVDTLHPDASRGDRGEFFRHPW